MTTSMSDSIILSSESTDSSLAAIASLHTTSVEGADYADNAGITSAGVLLREQ